MQFDFHLNLHLSRGISLKVPLLRDDKNKPALRLTQIVAMYLTRKRTFFYQFLWFLERLIHQTLRQSWAIRGRLAGMAISESFAR